MHFIYAARVRRFVNERKKHVSKSFLSYLDSRVQNIIESNIARLGSRLTLIAEDAEVYDSFTAFNRRK